MSKVPTGLMRQVVFDAPGGAEVLRQIEVSVPLPGAGEVRIRVRAAGMNRADVAQREGAYAPPPGASSVLGLEVSGIVDAVGEGVDPACLGDRVCSLTSGGGYSEWVCVPKAHCMPVPEGWSWEQAAAFPEVAMTVWSNVFQMGRLAPGETLLVHGGTSGIGAHAIALCRALGNPVITTVGSQAKAAAVRGWGAQAILYRDEDFVERVNALTSGRGVNVVLDMVGGDYLMRNVSCLALDGRVVQIAFLGGGAQAGVDLMALMRRRGVLTGSLLRPRSEAQKAQIVEELWARLFPLITSGRLGAPVIDGVYDFAEVAQAHARMESSQHIGKLVLTWSEP